jgi:hypothetical protein
MVKGLRVIFAPAADCDAAYSYPVPEPGTRGTLTAVRVGRGLRTYLGGPRGGLVYVEWDGDDPVCAVAMRDLKLEPAENERRR